MRNGKYCHIRNSNTNKELRRDNYSENFKVAHNFTTTPVTNNIERLVENPIYCWETILHNTTFIVKDHDTLHLLKRRKTLAELMIKYEKLSSGYTNSYTWRKEINYVVPYDLPPLYKVLQDTSLIDVLPELISVQKNVNMYIKYPEKDVRYIEPKVLHKKDVKKLFNEIITIRNHNHNINDITQEKKLASFDILLSCVQGSEWLDINQEWLAYNACHGIKEYYNEYTKFAKENLTDEFVQEFIHFYACNGNEFIDERTSNGMRATMIMERSSTSNKKYKKDYQKARRVATKRQFHPNGTYDDNYLSNLEITSRRGCKIKW